MNAIRKITGCLLVFCLTLTALCTQASGQSIPFDAYTYNEWGEAVASPSGYGAAYSFSLKGTQAGGLKEPSDMAYCAASGALYIADTGNNRIVVTDLEGKNARALSSFSTGDGGVETLNAPGGIFVDSGGTLYISDTLNGRVLICDGQGNIRKIIRQPDTDSFTQELPFQPQRVVADSTGILYVVSKGMYNGAVMMDQDGTFLGFYGSNKVKITASVILDRVWKKILSRDQRKDLAQYIPIEMTALAIDGSDMIYTCTLQTEDSLERIRKINSYNANILKGKAEHSFQGGFGDLQSFSYHSVSYSTAFVDLCVDGDGFIAALDSTTGRIFQYDAGGNLLFIFGGLGGELGLSRRPAALEAAGESLLLLDQQEGVVTLFSRTEFGTSLVEAIRLYNAGEYQASVAPWNNVLKMDANYNFAYTGLGKAYLEQGDYRAAMTAFEQGHYRYGYNNAYKEARSHMLRANLGWIFALLALLLLFLLRRRLPVIGRRLSAAKAARPEKKMTGARVLFSNLVHPVDGWQEMYLKKTYSLPLAAGVALVFFFATVLQYQYTGFIFCDYNKEEMNILFLFLQTFLLCALFAMVNWALCTLFEGRGTIKEIFCAVTYSLVPYIGSMLLYTALTNYLVTEEQTFLIIIRILGFLWSAFLMVKSLEACHEYSMKTTLLSIVLTILGLLVLVFVFTLVLSLSQQFIGFIVTIVKECMLRRT